MKRFLIVALLSSPYLCMFSTMAQSATPSTALSASAPVFNHDPNSFDFWVGEDAQAIRTVGGTIKCGLVPKSAMAMLLAEDVDQLLGQAMVSFGNGQTVSYDGAAEFHQAVSGLFHLAHQVTLASKKPSSAECNNVRNTQLPAVTKRSIDQGAF